MNEPDAQITVPVLREPTVNILAAAVASVRAEQASDDSELKIFNETVVAMNFDPGAPIPVVPPTRRERRHDLRQAKGLTARVWASILPDGTIDPAKAVPISAVNTGELPQVEAQV